MASRRPRGGAAATPRPVQPWGAAVAGGLAVACLLRVLPPPIHRAWATGQGAWVRGGALWLPQGSGRLSAAAHGRAALALAATAQLEGYVDPVVLEKDEAAPPERPRYSYSKVTRPKPVTMQGRHSTDVPLDWNPLLEEVDGLPNYGEVRPEHLVSAMHMAVDQFGKDIERIQISLNVSIARPWRLTWEKFAAPMEMLLDRVDRIWAAIGMLRDANDTSVELHRAYNELVPLLTEISTILAQSDDVYEALRLLTHDPKLTEAQRRIADRYMLQAWQAGIGLDVVEVARQFNKDKHELSYLATLFANNIATDEEQVVHLAESAEEVAGLPPSVRDAAAAAARGSGHVAASAEEGPWLLRLSEAERDAVLERGENRALRREVYLAAGQRGWRNTTGAEDAPEVGDNTWIVRRMLELRHQWARNVSYESFAEMVIANRMASAGQVYAFLGSLQNASLTAASAEFQELRVFARESGQAKDLEPWDLRFWRERLREKRLGLSIESMRPYLALPGVLAGLFNLVRRLFGVRLVAADGLAPTWQKGVRFFRVLDANTSVPIGGLYLDAHGGPRKRRAGFWADTALSYSRLLGVHGSPRRPVVHIVGDAALPEQEGAPTLLTFSQVLDLFRAMGHALQELLTDQEEGLAAGTKCMELDAVGWPRRFLELWAYDKATLSSLGRHFETGEPLPEALVNAVIASQSFHSGSRLLEEVRLARVDLDLHVRHEPGGDESPFDVARRVEDELSVLPSGMQGRDLCGFLGPFATGFAAGHYAELWAQVLAADAFEAFQEAGTEDDSSVRKLGLLLRASVLAPGGGRAPLAAFRDFRGRIPRIAPLLRRLGLSHGQAAAGAGSGVGAQLVAGAGTGTAEAPAEAGGGA